MPKSILLASVALFVAAACAREKAPDVMNTDNGSQPVARTTQCTVPNADGVRCDVKTCKADGASDCSRFEEGCVNSNHTYTGDKNAGTCKRGPLIGQNPKPKRVA